MDRATGEVRGVYSTEGEPDDVLLVACGSRRAARCRSCASRYRRDAFHLVVAGLRGGKGIPNSVESHPKVFATFTAPSFRAVHVRRVKGRKTLPCRPRDKARGSASSADRVNGWAVARVRNRIAVLPCRVDPGLLGE